MRPSDMLCTVLAMRARAEAVYSDKSLPRAVWTFHLVRLNFCVCDN